MNRSYDVTLFFFPICYPKKTVLSQLFFKPTQLHSICNRIRKPPKPLGPIDTVEIRTMWLRKQKLNHISNITNIVSCLSHKETERRKPYRFLSPLLDQTNIVNLIMLESEDLLWPCWTKLHIGYIKSAPEHIKKTFFSRWWKYRHGKYCYLRLQQDNSKWKKLSDLTKVSRYW